MRKPKQTKPLVNEKGYCHYCKTCNQWHDCLNPDPEKFIAQDDKGHILILDHHSLEDSIRLLGLRQREMGNGVVHYTPLK